MTEEFDVSGGWDLGERKSVYDDLEGIAKRKMKIFFLVDTSGSMKGSKIGTVNSTMEEMIPDIVKISEESAEANIEIAILAFSDSVAWMTPSPIPVEDFKWEYLSAKGLTALGAACKELDDKLSRKAFMADMVGNLAPVIILLTDGAPTDDYIGGLNALKQNKWFQQAIKVGIAIGNDAVIDVLEQFTGDKESVVRTYKLDELSEWIRFVTITASKIGSTSQTGKKGIGDDMRFHKEAANIGEETETPEEEDLDPSDIGSKSESGDIWEKGGKENQQSSDAHDDNSSEKKESDPWDLSDW